MRFWIPSSPARSSAEKARYGFAAAIRRAELDPFRFRIRRIGRNADRGGTIPRGVGEIDRRFESGNEPLVAVRGRVGDGR